MSYITCPACGGDCVQQLNPTVYAELRAACGDTLEPGEPQPDGYAACGFCDGDGVVDSADLELDPNPEDAALQQLELWLDDPVGDCPF